MVAHICNPSTWEAEARGSRVRGQPFCLKYAHLKFLFPLLTMIRSVNIFWFIVYKRIVFVKKMTIERIA
jgi:hypothetical protein